MMVSEVGAEFLIPRVGRHMQIPFSCSGRDWQGVFDPDNRMIDFLG